MAFYVYFLTDTAAAEIYTGMTDDLAGRAWMHRTHAVKGFTDRYNCVRLVWYEVHDSRESTFVRERRIKNCKREWKLNLIRDMNPDWRDLAEELN